jgi:hypothetical protein
LRWRAAMAQWPPPSRVRAANAPANTLQIKPAPGRRPGIGTRFRGGESVTSVRNTSTAFRPPQVSQRALIEINGLQPPYQLATGSGWCSLVNACIHRAGDTLNSISPSYDSTCMNWPRPIAGGPVRHPGRTGVAHPSIPRRSLP